MNYIRILPLICYLIVNATAQAETVKHRAIYNTNSCKVFSYWSEDNVSFNKEPEIIFNSEGLQNIWDSKFVTVFCPINNYIPEAASTGKLKVNIRFKNNFNTSKHQLNRFKKIGCALKTMNWSGQYSNSFSWSNFSGLVSKDAFTRQLSINWMSAGTAGLECLIGPGMKLLSYEVLYH